MGGTVISYRPSQCRCLGGQSLAAHQALGNRLAWTGERLALLGGDARPLGLRARAKQRISASGHVSLYFFGGVGVGGGGVLEPPLYWAMPMLVDGALISLGGAGRGAMRSG